MPTYIYIYIYIYMYYIYVYALLTHEFILFL